MAADVLAGDAPTVDQSLKSQVVVLAGAVTSSHAVLEEDYLVRIVAEAEIPHPHLLLFQVAVTAAHDLLAVPP